jgi:hypothetical protein
MIPGGYNRKKNKNKKSSSRMNISFFKKQLKQWRKIYFTWRSECREFKVPCTYTANLITGCYEQMKFSKEC